MKMVPGKTVPPGNHRPLSYNVGNVQTRFVDLLNPALVHWRQELRGPVYSFFIPWRSIR
jgi:hypothetical protein